MRRRTNWSARIAWLGALAAVVLAVPTLAQVDDDKTRAVRIIDQPSAPPATGAPAAPPSATPDAPPPLIAPAPPAAPLPQLVPPAPTPTIASPTALPPIVPPRPGPAQARPPVGPFALPPLVPPPPEPVPTRPSPAVVAPPAPGPTLPAPKSPAAAAPVPKSGPSNYEVMSLPPVEVKLPPTAAEISLLNASLKVANPSEVAIDILPGADITVGSRVSFRVATKKPGYLILVDVDAAGKLTQIYPNPMSLTTATAARQSSNYLRPDRPVQIPTPGDGFAGFEFVASPPFGTAMVVAILSDQPVQTVDLPDIPPSMTGRADALTYLTKLASELRVPGEGGARPQAARWSFDAKFYAIR
jgi:Domain of unknown function (DUF4384)